MHRRQITLEDGRYLIFYTFEDGVPADDETSRDADAPAPRPQAEEGRHV